MGGRNAIRGACLVLVSVIGVGSFAGAGCVATPVVADESRALQDLRSLVARFDGKPSSGDLQSFEVSHPNTRAGNLARFLRGYLAFDAGDWAAAVAALDHSTIARSTSVGDYTLLYRGRAEAKLGRYKEAEENLEHVAEKYPDSLVARDASFEAAKIAMSIGAETDFNHDLEPLIAANDGDALVLMAQYKASRGDTPGAIRYHRMAYFYAPGTAAAVTAVDALEALGADPRTGQATEQELRARATRLFADRAYAPAKEAYSQLLSAYPNAKDRDELNLNRGIAAGATRDVATATASLLAISEGNKALHPQALYQLATAYRLAGQTPQFESTGARLRTTYPKSSWTGRYLGDFAELLEAKNRIGELLQVQRALISGFPENEKAAEASYDLAWLAYRTRDYGNAAQLFTEHLATFRTPTTKWVGEAAFWGARAWEHLGNKPRALLFYELARQRYPYGYHGHVAGNRARDLQRRTPNLKAEEPPAGSPVAEARVNALTVKPLEETADRRAEPRVARASDFKSLRLFDLAIRELTAAQAIFADSPLVNLRLAQIYQARGDNYQATLILRKGYPDIYSYRDEDVPREAWEVMFPLTHWETIKQQANAQNVDPFIIAGLIRQESVFNPKAISRANARGLMQLLPSTGRLVAKSSGLGSVGPADLYTPTINITLGTAFFAQQLRNFGRVEFAAAAYNAGPGRVVQWKAARPADPIEEWVENIPFKETRGYVMGVLRYAANYRRFYGKGDERGDQEW